MADAADDIVANHDIFECEKHEILNCSLCKPKKVEPKDPRDVSLVKGRFRGVQSVGLRAEFESLCAACGGDILVGDPIKSDTGGWAHTACP